MRKSFVVVAYTDEGQDTDKNVIYAGDDMQKAKGYTVDTYTHTLELQVWVGGKRIAQYKRTDMYQWELELDIKKSLESELDKLQKEKEKIEGELNALNYLLDGEDE